MNFKFHPSAKSEFEDTVSYYEKCRTGLGVEFSEEVYTTITRIIAYPNAWSKLSENSRRCLMNRFPYGIIYQVKASEVWIIAIAELHRRPDYWQYRE
jgi:hypothetical protein